jgi:heterotetrameric sarcosine oxidase delta subunit
MLRIECPWCGVRNEDEFAYGGDATVERPAEDASNEEWSRFVHMRNNPAGDHTEHWQHLNGCRAWITVVRNTVTHKISSIAPASHTLPFGDNVNNQGT